MILAKETLDLLPALYSTEKVKFDDKQIICKFVLSNWAWYAVEFNGSDLFFGYVDGDFPEWGYFSLSEFESVNKANTLTGLEIIQDLEFIPCKFKELKI